jgi:ferredoxin-NADP reductase
MQHFSLTVDTEDQVREVMERLWNHLRIRGEVQIRPLDGKFRLDVISERDLTPAQLERLPGKRG